ncbi:protein containing Pyridoxamine 5'-phosphate oxidase-related, FMN-binding core domain [sediment metagenome]|uniref:Protein containing Pyridoxamine 5'-phosphate oxidase-related, FMN-binding core domain n=1 Tax=sediment metagenome TaxID=749907 RepID=D9PJR8_9ZZZZ
MPLNKREIKKILNNTDIMYIATSSKGAEPHIAPLWFIFHKGKVYFETHLPTKKFKNISKNNRIALCFGGEDTYIIEGSVKWWEEKDAPIPFRKLFWKKYREKMDDSYITDKTRIFEFIIEKEISWHYWPTWE